MDGAHESLRLMHAGEVIGETALLSGRRRTASVVALSDVTVRVVTRDSLERELERNDWMRALFHGLAERFRELDAVLTDLLRAHDDP
jgi:CRP-like cAMP-binding protein